MMKKTLNLFLLVAMLVSCDKLENVFRTAANSNETQIEIRTSDVLFTSEGGNNIIMFTTTESWTAEILNSLVDSWCSICPSSGPAGDAIINITTKPNDTHYARTSFVVITAGIVSKNITISQQPKEVLVVTPLKFDIAALGGELKVEVISNIDYNIVISNDWIKPIDTRSLQSKSLAFEILQNTDKKDRRGFVKFISKDETTSQIVYVNQACANGNIEDIENGDTNEW